MVVSGSHQANLSLLKDRMKLAASTYISTNSLCNYNRAASNHSIRVAASFHSSIRRNPDSLFRGRLHHSQRCCHTMRWTIGIHWPLLTISWFSNNIGIGRVYRPGPSYIKLLTQLNAQATNSKCDLTFHGPHQSWFSIHTTYIRLSFQSMRTYSRPCSTSMPI